jgi:hypothetical protein
LYVVDTYEHWLTLLVKVTSYWPLPGAWETDATPLPEMRTPAEFTVANGFAALAPVTVHAR